MSETGKMILINLYHSQLEPGRDTPHLERHDIAVSYLTPTWLTSVRQYLFQHILHHPDERHHASPPNKSRPIYNGSPAPGAFHRCSMLRHQLGSTLSTSLDFI